MVRGLHANDDEEVRELLKRSRAPPSASPEAIRPLTGELSDYDWLIERASAARYVLLGEASHGTHEFYRERAEITKRLIAEAGFTAVAVEADWPDAYRVNRYVRGASEDRSADQALSDFRRFPVWMWRNAEVAEFVTCCASGTTRCRRARSVSASMGSTCTAFTARWRLVVEFLDEIDPEAARRARERYACFDQFGRDPQVYAYETGIAGAEPCEQQAVEQLLELQKIGTDADGDRSTRTRHFYAEQNARLVANAEQYYRAMYRGGVRLDELVGVCEASFGALLERPHHDRVEFVWHDGVARSRRCRALFDVLQQDGDDGLPLERNATGQQLVEDDSDRVVDPSLR